MKTIAVLVPSFTIEYSIDILSGIYDYFSEKDFRVVVAQTKHPYGNPGTYDYQYWSSIEYLRAEDIDAYIVLSGLYVSIIDFADFEKIISSFAPRPVISIGVKVDLPNVYSIVTDCRQSFLEIVEHLKKQHKCKKIAFCSANKTNSSDAIERYEAFIAALKKHHLKFNIDYVMDGFFTDFGAYQSLKETFPVKEKIDFDAIVCANDSMAVGCMKALREYGIRVPEDIKIVGFDDALVSKISEPKISTINQNIYKQGYMAAEVIVDIFNNKEVSKNINFHLEAKFRQSCGCIDVTNSDQVYINNLGEECKEENYAENTLTIFGNEMNEKNNLITLIDTVKGSNTLKQFFFNLKYIADQCDMDGVSVHFFQDVMYIDQNETFVLPESMELSMVSDRINNVDVFKPGFTYNPKKTILPSRTLKDTPGFYILHPIFAGESNFGYFLCKTNAKQFPNHIVHLKIIVSAIAQSYDYTNQILENQKLLSEKSDLAKQSRTDELTGLLNRRGFIERGQEILDVIQETDKSGLVFFADMDGLKYINDNFGHEMGDEAIKLQAEVLKEAFGVNDVVGRLSGDEFGIVAVDKKLKSLESVRLKVDMLDKKYSITHNLPFTLSISLGAVDLQSSSVLKKLLKEADESLYEEKHKHHERLSGRS